MKVIAHELDAELSWSEKALSISSHNAEAQHLKVLTTLLGSTSEEQLHLPEAVALLTNKNGERSKLFHPCSAKHAATLRACEILGWPKENYWLPEHPYQNKFLTRLSQILRKKDFELAIDGCSFPTPALKLSEQAQVFNHLASTYDEDWVWESMEKEHFLIGGSERLDTAILEIGRGKLMAKEGADGLLAIAIIEDDRFPEGLSIIIKLANGRDNENMQLISSRILASLGFELVVKYPKDQSLVFHSQLLPESLSADQKAQEQAQSYPIWSRA